MEPHVRKGDGENVVKNTNHMCEEPRVHEFF